MRTNNKKSNCKSCKEKGSQKFNYMLILGFISFVFMIYGLISFIKDFIGFF